jgi:DSF synthase
MEMHVPSAVLEVRHVPVSQPLSTGVAMSFSSQLRANYDKETRAMWSRWSPEPRPCFNPSLLADIRAYYDFLAASGARVDCMGEEQPIEYVVLASAIPGVFNLGGDLDLFKQLIDGRDRQGLLRYGRACIDVLYRNYLAHDLPLTTISLVQGECLGGGFEAALSSDVIVAERNSRFGFPEILFNMFPGMGAYSFLERKVGQKTAEEMIASGRIYSAEEMLALGVIDAVTDTGQGEDGVAQLIRSRSRSRNGLAALAATRRRVHRIEFSELLDVIQIWVDSAMRLTTRDLKLMQRLVSRQNGLTGESSQIH